MCNVFYKDYEVVKANDISCRCTKINLWPSANCLLISTCTMTSSNLRSKAPPVLYTKKTNVCPLELYNYYMPWALVSMDTICLML